MSHHHKKSRVPKWGPWSEWERNEQRGQLMRSREDGQGRTEYQYGQWRSELERTQPAQQSTENPRYTEAVPELEPQDPTAEMEYPSTTQDTGYTLNPPYTQQPAYTTGQNNSPAYMDRNVALAGMAGSASLLRSPNPPYKSSSGNFQARTQGFSSASQGSAPPASWDDSDGQGNNAKEDSDPESDGDSGVGAVTEGTRGISFAPQLNATRRGSQDQWGGFDRPPLPEVPDEEEYEEEYEQQPQSGQPNKQRQKRVIRTADPSRDTEPLKAAYHRHKSSDFKKCRVFKMLWTEPRGDTGDDEDFNQTSMDGDQTRNDPDKVDGSLVDAKYGEKAYSTIRRFVIARARQGHCLCVPIMTYNGRGAGKPGVKYKHHAIVHTRSKAPKELSGEPKLKNKPIKMVPKTERDTLVPSSRINYSKIYTVEHNVKVSFIGKIDKDSEKIFLAGCKKALEEDESSTEDN